MCQGTCQQALEFGVARQQLQVGSLQNSGVTEWFGRDTLKLISFHPLSWAGMPSPSPGCSKPHPTLPGTKFLQAALSKALIMQARFVKKGCSLDTIPNGY